MRRVGRQDRDRERTKRDLRTWLVLGALVVATAAVRVTIAATVPLHRLVDPDTPGYLGPALALARHGRFSAGPNVPFTEFVRTPGYPLLLAGLDLVVGHSIRTLAVTQAVLSSFTAIGVFALARRWWGNVAIALGAAAIAAFEPLQLWSAVQTLTESLSAASYVVLALVATWAAVSTSARRWAVVGAVVAVATYIRPTTYYFPLVFAPALFVMVVRRATTHRLRAATACALAFFVPCALLVGAWQWRNHHEVGSWRFSGVEALNMFEYRAVAINASKAGKPFTQTRNLMVFFFDAEHRGERTGPYFDHMYDAGFRIVRDNPTTFLTTTARGTTTLVFGVNHVLLDTLGLDDGGGSPFTWLAEAGLLVFYAATAVGAVWAVRRRHSDGPGAAHVLVALLVVYTVLAAGNPRATARLRAPLMPLLCPYAAAGIAAIADRVREARTGARGGPALVTAGR